MAVEMFPTAVEMFPTAAGLMEFVENTLSHQPNQEPQQVADKESKYREFVRLHSTTRPTSDVNTILREARRVYDHILRQKSVAENFATKREQRFLMHLSVHHCLVFYSNAFGGGGSEKIYIIASYFNNSCVPNILLTNIGHLRTGIILKPVKNGDQLFTTYIGADQRKQPTGDRQTYLQRWFGFRCDCEN